MTIPVSDEARAAEEAVSRVRANGAASEFLRWLRGLSSIGDVRATVGDEGPVLWAVQERDDPRQAREIYEHLFRLLGKDGAPYLELHVVLRGDRTDSLLAGAHRL